MEILIVIFISAAAVAAVLYPIVGARRARPPVGGRASIAAGDPAASRAHRAAGSAAAGASLDGDELDAEVARYRDAVRARTACGRCGLANPIDSRYCAECGRLLDAHLRRGNAS